MTNFSVASLFFGKHKVQYGFTLKTVVHPCFSWQWQFQTLKYLTWYSWNARPARMDMICVIEMCQLNSDLTRPGACWVGLGVKLLQCHFWEVIIFCKHAPLWEYFRIRKWDEEEIKFAFPNDGKANFTINTGKCYQGLLKIKMRNPAMPFLLLSHWQWFLQPHAVSQRLCAVISP